MAMVEEQRLLEEGSVVKELVGSFTEETLLLDCKVSVHNFNSLLDNPDLGHLVFQIGKIYLNKKSP